MVITDAWIASVASHVGGWSAVQLALLGIRWPPQSGWRQRLIGTEIPDATAQRVADLAGVHLSKTERRRTLAALYAPTRPPAPPLAQTNWDTWVERPTHTGPGWAPALCTVCRRQPSRCRCSLAATYRAAHDTLA